MRDQHYSNKTIRMADKTWESLKDKRKKSGESWNLFLLQLLNLHKKYGQQEKSNKRFWSEKSASQGSTPAPSNKVNGKLPPPNSIFDKKPIN